MGGPRFARLADDWLLRGWTDLPWAAVNWKRGAFRTLSRDEFDVARQSDGKTDFRSAAVPPAHRAILDLFLEQGLVSRCRPGARLHPRQEYRRAANPFLHGLHWSVTGRCNLRCRHCFMEAPAHRYRELSRAEALSLIDQFERANVPQVALTGGEPFVRPDLGALAEHLVDRRIGITEIATNGVLVTDRRLDLFRRLDVRPLFKISFDGCGAHDVMRGVPGVEARVVRAIERVRAAGFPVAVITSLDRLGAATLGRTYELMKQLGVGEWCVGVPGEAGTWRQADTALSLQETIDACLGLAARWRDEDRPLRIWLWRFGRLPGRADPRPRNAGETAGDASRRGGWNCPSTHWAPYVLPDATLLPCGGYTGSSVEKSMPNLRHDEFGRAWSDSPLRRIADLRRAEVAARNRSCARCESFADCRGGCRVQALRRTGDLMAKDPVMCALWKKGAMQRFRAVVTA